MEKKNILVIEDDRLIASSLMQLLVSNDMSVMIAARGDLAIQLCRNHEFDLIISDIKMPGEIGTEVVKKINADRVTPLPFLFITGYSDEKDIQEAELMGCRDFLMKPFDIDVILDSIKRVLNDPYMLNEPFQKIEKPIIHGHEPPSRIKRFFYSALGSQWNPEKEVDWNEPLGIDDALCPAMAFILSPIIMGEYSAFNGIPQRIISFSNYEVKQYLAAQLVDETRHAEAFDLYLKE